MQESKATNTIAIEKRKAANEFDAAILLTLSCIPYGKVCTYGLIAKLAGQYGAARHVGYLLKNLPENSTIPWHRVLNAQGKSSFPEGSEKQKLQLSKLKSEGITSSNQKISLKQFKWDGSL